MLRTCICSDINENMAGKEVVLCGWVDTRRDHGKIIFIDLRDRYGKLQVVFTPKPYKEAYSKAKQLHNEDVVRIKGDINLRPKGTENPNIPMGNFEMFAKDIEYLSRAEELPFPVEDTIEAQEEVRLKHRYIDLRRAPMLKNLVLRHSFNHKFRSFLDKKRFLEVDTPFLTKSTPEGARDFLVPSRLSSGKFYALPQSPQLFKQILMASGIDRYYQIAKCFRDEDLRRDRQPEFSQLDLEMSFVEEEDIYALCEEMFSFVFKEVLGENIVIPFPRISYEEAMEKYSSDKPDIGEGKWRFLWVVDFPLFEFNEEEKRWQPKHHPFTAPRDEDIEILDKDLSQVRSRSYDLVLNGNEIASGSIRIHSYKLQEKIFSIIGLSQKEAQERFGFLIRAFKYGVPPHGGIAFGLDRLYAIISGSGSIRDVIAFPKTQRGICPLTDAPSYVSSTQLKELYLDVVQEDEKLR